MFCPRHFCTTKSLTNWLAGAYVATSDVTRPLNAAAVLFSAMLTQRYLIGFDFSGFAFVTGKCVYIWATLTVWPNKIWAFWCTRYSKDNWQHCITMATLFMRNASPTNSTSPILMGLLHHLMVCNLHDSLCTMHGYIRNGNKWSKTAFLYRSLPQSFELRVILPSRVGFNYKHWQQL